MKIRTIQNILKKLIIDSIKSCQIKNLFFLNEFPLFNIESTKNSIFGDYACNIAMIIGSKLKINSRQIAIYIIDNMNEIQTSLIKKIEIGGSGFINFFINPYNWFLLLEKIENEQEKFGEINIGKGEQIHIEFVSANPTGPLHIGHARGAIIGDVIAAILKSTGYSVFKEYYVNNVGTQMNLLGESVFLRYRELLNENIFFSSQYYQGQYIVDLAKKLVIKYKTDLLNNPNAIKICQEYASSNILDGIKKDLQCLGVNFDRYFFESEIYNNNLLHKTIQKLQENKILYQTGKTIWFKTIQYGDEKDRVVIKENGEFTYFASDIVYHKDKLKRGFKKIINIWGADHHGYIARIKAAIESFGYKKNLLKVILVQLVSLFRNGVPVIMSTRSGDFITLEKVLNEVGKDAIRYNFLMRSSDSQLEFDLEDAKKKSNENPVYYIQYAYARINSILKISKEKNILTPRFNKIDLKQFFLQEEIKIAKILGKYPEIIQKCSTTLELHHLVFYLNELASLFHSYYKKYRILSTNLKLSQARLFLLYCIQIVLKNALTILGVSTPERM